MNHGRHAHQNRRFCLEALSSPNFPPHCEKRPCTFIFVFHKKTMELNSLPSASPWRGETRPSQNGPNHLRNRWEAQILRPPLARRPCFPSLQQKKAPGNSQIGPRKAAEGIELTRANYSPRVRFKLSTENSSKIANEELNISGPILRRSPWTRHPSEEAKESITQRLPNEQLIN